MATVCRVATSASLVGGRKGAAACSMPRNLQLRARRAAPPLPSRFAHQAWNSRICTANRARRSAAAAWKGSGEGSSGGAGRLVSELVKEASGSSRGDVLSEKLDADVRRRAEAAISGRQGRVTVGDVAADAGLTLLQSEQALRALAADSLATLQVSESGEILYVFPRDFRDSIRARSLRMRLEPAFATVASALGYLARVAFGTTLFVSVATVFLGLMVISSSSNDDRNRRGSGGYSYQGGMRFDLFDLWWFWDPSYGHRRRVALANEAAEGRGMSFLEAVFSWVFGDGDPNEGFERTRWEAIGAYIQYKGGIVTAEELAPFLDLQPKQLASDRGRVVVDESYVLPVLARLRGEPVVDSQGQILYSFPELQGTSEARRQLPSRLAALEERQQLTAAGGGQVAGVVALGLANLVGVVMLASALANPVNCLALIRNGLGWIISAQPLLQAYAGVFFAAPLIRWVLQQRANAIIDARNIARKTALALLQSPDPTLRAKLAAAQQLAGQRVFQEQAAVYRTDRDVTDQRTDLEGDLFEQRLQQREQERQRQWKGQPAPQRDQKQKSRQGEGWW